MVFTKNIIDYFLIGAGIGRTWASEEEIQEIVNPIVSISRAESHGSAFFVSTFIPVIVNIQLDFKVKTCRWSG